MLFGQLLYFKESDHAVYLNMASDAEKVNDRLFVKIARVNDDVARVYFVNGADDALEPIPIPDGFAFHNISTDTIVSPLRNEWFINWTSSYALTHNRTRLITIRNQRQQAIHLERHEDSRGWTVAADALGQEQLHARDDAPAQAEVLGERPAGEVGQ